MLSHRNLILQGVVWVTSAWICSDLAGAVSWMQMQTSMHKVRLVFLLASLDGHAETVKLLLDKGAEVSLLV